MVHEFHSLEDVVVQDTADISHEAGLYDALGLTSVNVVQPEKNSLLGRVVDVIVASYHEMVDTVRVADWRQAFASGGMSLFGTDRSFTDFENARYHLRSYGWDEAYISQKSDTVPRKVLRYAAKREGFLAEFDRLIGRRRAA